MKSALAVLVGYLVFGVSAVFLFQLSGIDSREQPGAALFIGSTLYGVAFALLAGYVAGLLAGTNETKHAVAVACIMAALAAISLIAQPGEGSHWSQISALIFMAPSAILGGALRAWQGKRRRDQTSEDGLSR